MAQETEKFTLGQLDEIGKISSEFNLVYYYKDGSFDYADHSYDTVEDAFDKARTELQTNQDLKRVNIVYMATGWYLDGIPDTIIEQDIAEVV